VKVPVRRSSVNCTASHTISQHPDAAGIPNLLTGSEKRMLMADFGPRRQPRDPRPINHGLGRSQNIVGSETGVPF